MDYHVQPPLGASLWFFQTWSSPKNVCWVLFMTHLFITFLIFVPFDLHTLTILSLCLFYDFFPFPLHVLLSFCSVWAWPHLLTRLLSRPPQLFICCHIVIFLHATDYVVSFCAQASCLSFRTTHASVHWGDCMLFFLALHVLALCSLVVKPCSDLTPKPC